MGKLKFSNLQEFDQFARSERKKRKLSNEYNRQRFEQSIEKKRAYYKEQFRRQKSKQVSEISVRSEYEKTLKAQKGKSREQIAKLWKRYNNKKEVIKAAASSEFNLNTKRWEIPTGELGENSGAIYKKFKGRKKVRFVMVVIEFENEEGDELFISTSYNKPNPTPQQLQEFVDDFIETLPNQTSQGLITKIVQTSIIVYT